MMCVIIICIQAVVCERAAALYGDNIARVEKGNK